MRRLLIGVLVGASLAWASPAGAQDDAPPEGADPEAADLAAAPTEPDAPSAEAEPEAEHTSASVADAPPPDQVANRSAPPSRAGEWALWIPRVAFFPFRVAAEVIAAPVRWGLYAYEVYNLGPRVKSIFFNEDGTVGLYPTALIETGFGLNVGGRLILRRIVGDTQLTGRAGFGGRFRQVFSSKISTKDTFKRFELELEGTYEVRPKDRFYGIGNGEITEMAPAAPLDPFGETLVKSRFRQDAIRVAAGATYRLGDNVGLKASGAIVDRTFDEGEDATPDDQQIEQNFDTGALTGYGDGTQTLYGELELTYDSRRSVSRYEGTSTPSTGWLAQVYAGYTLGLGDDPARYVRYGGDVQRYFRLGDAPRTLALRAYAEGVTGDYDEVAFYDLARLGGPLLLRGFDQDQFRDRIAALGSAEYQFDAVEFVSGFLFADVGRVYTNINELELSGMRLGFGGGVELHTKGSFLGRLTLASSIDGGFFLSLSFDPVYDVKARVERK